MRLPTVINNDVTADLKNRAASDRFQIHGLRIQLTAGNFVDVFVEIGGTETRVLHTASGAPFNTTLGMDAIESLVNGGIS